MSEYERREHKRYTTKGSFLIYKSVSIIAYAVELKNISRSGAFIETNHLPPLGEELIFDILDGSGVKVAAGQGRVVRICREGMDNASGFSVQFSRKLPRELEEMLVEEQV